MLEEAKSDVEKEPILSSYYHSSITSHPSLASALANILSVKLSTLTLPSITLFELFISVLQESPEIIESVKQDLLAAKERDPACLSYVHCFLSFKGFLACQAHRIAHKLWKQDRKILALLIQNRVSESFAVDFHPGAKIGKGVLLDHATGVVIGETAVVGDNVSILHGVTLGGTGKQCGDRHPKIGDGVLIGAGTCVLGNITIGEGAKVGSGSVVLKDVPPHTTAVGNPARLIGGKENPKMLDKIPGLSMDQTSYLTECRRLVPRACIASALLQDLPARQCLRKRLDMSLTTRRRLLVSRSSPGIPRKKIDDVCSTCPHCDLHAPRYASSYRRGPLTFVTSTVGVPPLARSSTTKVSAEDPHRQSLSSRPEPHIHIMNLVNLMVGICGTLLASRRLDLNAPWWLKYTSDTCCSWPDIRKLWLRLSLSSKSNISGPANSCF
ncbi:hypothetical protein N665_1136s0004 [Sinapis alba]|nr:hypothetical protein N665_1136s0004 [Sinapis alba]